MNRRTFLKYLGIGAVGAVLGTYDYGQLSGSSANVIGNDYNNGDNDLVSKSDGDMLYREMPHTGQKISAISLGIGSLHEASDR